MRPMTPTSVTSIAFAGVNVPRTAMRPDTIVVPVVASRSASALSATRPSSASPPGPDPVPIAISVNSTAVMPRLFPSMTAARPASVKRQMFAVGTRAAPPRT